MFERFALLMAAGAGLLAATAIAAAEAPEPAPKAQLICRGAARQLGSHIVTPRRCRTAEQWQAEDEERARQASTLQMTEGQNDGHAPRTPQ
jgi:hypothetical protein